MLILRFLLVSRSTPSLRNALASVRVDPAAMTLRYLNSWYMALLLCTQLPSVFVLQGNRHIFDAIMELDIQEEVVFVVDLVLDVPFLILLAPSDVDHDGRLTRFEIER